RCRCIGLLIRDPAHSRIYTLSLHDALPICVSLGGASSQATGDGHHGPPGVHRTARSARSSAPIGLRCPRPSARTSGASSLIPRQDRKSTRLNSSHDQISYAVFCLKKKKHTS